MSPGYLCCAALGFGGRAPPVAVAVSRSRADAWAVSFGRGGSWRASLSDLRYHLRRAVALQGAREGALEPLDLMLSCM